jgi:ribosomal protein S18 acetylase RimI-like enzyme
VLDLDGHWHLEQIAVDPAHGRRGIGAALLEATHGELVARGAREVTLMTYADVPWNGPFYARHGYVELDPLPERLEPMRATELRMGMDRHGRRIAMVRPLTMPGTWVKTVA